MNIVVKVPSIPQGIQDPIVSKYLLSNKSTMDSVILDLNRWARDIANLADTGIIHLASAKILVGNNLGLAAPVDMSSEATINNSGQVTLANSAVIGKVLTGYTVGSGSISATDSILSAFNKLGYDKHVAVTLDSLTGITLTGQALSYTTGYALPTTAKQGNWDSAYGWGNHAGLYLPIASTPWTALGYITGIAYTNNGSALASSAQLDLSVVGLILTSDMNGVHLDAVTGHSVPTTQDVADGVTAYGLRHSHNQLSDLDTTGAPTFTGLTINTLPFGVAGIVVNSAGGVFGTVLESSLSVSHAATADNATNAGYATNAGTASNSNNLNGHAEADLSVSHASTATNAVAAGNWVVTGGTIDDISAEFTIDGSSNLAVAANAVGAAKLHALAANIVFGRITAGAGVVEELTAANLKTICAYYSGVTDNIVGNSFGAASNGYVAKFQHTADVDYTLTMPVALAGATGYMLSSTDAGVLSWIAPLTLSGLGGQPALNGTGFVKASGTTISYDNSTYYKSGDSPSFATTILLTGANPYFSLTDSSYPAESYLLQPVSQQLWIRTTSDSGATYRNTIKISNTAPTDTLVFAATTGAATFASTITSTGLTVNGALTTTLNIKSQVTGDAVERIHIRGNGDIYWGAGSGAVDTNLYRSAANMLKTDDSMTIATDLTIGRASGNRTFTLISGGATNIAFTASVGTGHLYYGLGGVHLFEIAPNDVSMLSVGLSGVVINETGGANYDFRVEGDTDANLFFVDAGADLLGIGTGAPESKVQIGAIYNGDFVDATILNRTKLTVTCLTNACASNVNAAAEPALILHRGGDNGVTYPLFAEFRLSRWLTGSASQPFPQLDICLNTATSSIANTRPILSLRDNGSIILPISRTPASSTDTGTVGEICWDANYIYVCTATDYWERTAIAHW